MDTIRRRPVVLATALVVLMAGALGRIAAEPAASAQRAADPVFTITYAGSASNTLTYANPAHGHIEMSVAWSFSYTGPLSTFSGVVPFRAVRLGGSYSATYPAPNESASCAYKLSAGRLNSFAVTRDGGTLTIDLAVPNAVRFDPAKGQVAATKTGGADCAIEGGLPLTGNWTDPAQNRAAPRLVYDVDGDPTLSRTFNAHLKFDDGRRNDYVLKSTVTIGGAVAPPPVRVWSVEVDGTPVVADQLPREERDVSTVRVAAACPRSTAVYLDCERPIPDGSPDKVWPVSYVRGSRMTVAEARFRVGRGLRLTKAKLVGASAYGRFLATDISHDPGDDGEIVATRLVSNRRLPDHVGQAHAFSIRWRLIDRDGKGRTYDAGTTRIPLFVTLGPPVRVELGRGKHGRAPVPFLTPLDFTTSRAGGLADPVAVADAIWGEFPDRRVLARTLDPVSGEITSAARLYYWDPRRIWTLDDFLKDTFAADPCRDTEALLARHQATCGGWASLLADALALHGIRSRHEAIADEPGWSRLAPADAQFMLVRPWRFSPPHGQGAYPYLYVFRRTPSGGRVERADLHYLLPGFRSTGQGNPPAPPGVFRVGDHDVVRLGDTLFDPSYGTRFSTLGQWAAASLAGWGSVDDDPSPGASQRCRVGHTCYFAARIHR